MHSLAKAFASSQKAAERWRDPLPTDPRAEKRWLCASSEQRGWQHLPQRGPPGAAQRAGAV